MNTDSEVTCFHINKVQNVWRYSDCRKPFSNSILRFVKWVAQWLWCCASVCSFSLITILPPSVILSFFKYESKGHEHCSWIISLSDHHTFLPSIKCNQSSSEASQVINRFRPSNRFSLSKRTLSSQKDNKDPESLLKIVINFSLSWSQVKRQSSQNSEMASHH